MSKRLKLRCTVTPAYDGRVSVEPCDAVADFFSKSGLKMVSLGKFTDDLAIRSAMVLHRSRKMGDWIKVNFCPICGTAINGASSDSYGTFSPSAAPTRATAAKEPSA